MKKLILCLLISLASFSNVQVFGEVQQIVVEKGDDLDKLWGLYHSSKDKAYLQQILEVINREDDEAVFLAYEYLNRMFIADLTSKMQKTQVKPNLEDIHQIISKKEIDKPAFKKDFILISTAMWSVNDQRKIKQIQDDYSSIVLEHPELDYSTKIKKILGK